LTLPAAFSLRPGFGFGGILKDTLPEALRDAGPAAPVVGPGEDEAWMLETLRTAMTHHGLSDPNPVVGCLVVRDGRVVSRGATERIGERHAERDAIEAVADRSVFRGATAYVTLEPCSHHGRQPPCADLLASVGLARCVVALRDPNPLVNGVSAFPVFTTASSPRSATSHPQPLPNCEADVLTNALAKPPWPEAVASLIRDRLTSLRNDIARSVADLNRDQQRTLRGLLVWAALSWRTAQRVEQALPNPLQPARFDAISDAWFAWRMARRATIGRFRLN